MHIVSWLLRMISAAEVNRLSAVRAVWLRLALIDLSFDRLVEAIFVKHVVPIARQLNNSIIVLEVNQADIARLLFEILS